jgi:hypothetical protein
MNIGNVIYSMVTADTNLVNLIGNRIYPEEAPMEITYPYITYTKINTDPTRVKNLVSPKDNFKINFFIYSKNYDTTSTIADLLRVALDNKRGVYANVNVDWVIFEDETTGDPVMQDKIYWIVQDYLFKINNI